MQRFISRITVGFLLICLAVYVCGVISVLSTDRHTTETTTTTPVVTPLEDTTHYEDDTQNNQEETSSNNKLSESLVSQDIHLPVDSFFEIRFIDVGEADAALVNCDGHYMLIDGGNKSDSSKIFAILKQTSVETIDIIVGSHPHEDHIGGLPGAYNYTTANLTLCSVTSYDSDAFEDFKKYADKSGGGITVPNVGDTYKLGSATIEILGVNSGVEINDTSIVLKIVYGDTSFLFTGDAERTTEQVMLAAEMDLSADVLKVGHHGSESSTTYPFLRDVMPQYAVISVGDNNSYGHPTDDVLSRLRDADVTVFRTDMQGDIYCTSDGKSITFKVEKNADVDTLTNPVKVVETEHIIEKQDQSTVTTSIETVNYILNTNTHKFHYPNCSSVGKMKESNKKSYNGTRDDLITQGFSPCGNCHP